MSFTIQIHGFMQAWDHVVGMICVLEAGGKVGITRSRFLVTLTFILQPADTTRFIYHSKFQQLKFCPRLYKIDIMTSKYI